METRTIAPRGDLLVDPRSIMEEGALVLARHNSFPVVGTRKAGKDSVGLVAGMLGALTLGCITFLSMSGGRERDMRRPAPLPPARRALSGQRSLPAIVPVQRMVTPVGSTPAPLAGSTVDGPHSPVMVFDISTSPDLPARAVTPGVPPATKAAAAGQQGLSENEAFAARVGDSSVDVASASSMADPASTVAQGTLIPAILETAIDSDLPGYVRAVVSQNILSFDGSHVLIPRSTRLIGQYKSGLSAGQTRAYVMWTRLIRPDGVSVSLASPAVDFAGRTGLTGEVDGHFMKRFGSAMLLSVIGGIGTVAGGTSVVLSSGQSASSVAAQRDSTIPPTIRVRQGQPIRVFTARDLDFSTVASGPEVAR